MSLIHSPTVGLFDNSHIMHNCQFWTFFLHLTSYLPQSATRLFLPFVPACTYTWPLHLLAFNISLCSCLCPSHLHVPFLSPPPCTFTPTCGHISSLYILCQYLDQPLHYLKYLDEFLSVLLTTITTGLVFARQSKQGVITLTLYFDPNYTLS